MLVAGLVVIGAVVTSGGSGSASPVAVARPFSLGPVAVGGSGASLAAAPGRPVVLTFFAAWCDPCRRELPLLERLAASGRVGVVGVDEIDQRPDGPDMVRQTGVTFPTGYDHDGAVGRAWAVNGLPITVFIAGDGRVVAYHRGELNSRHLDDLVARLLAGDR